MTLEIRNDDVLAIAITKSAKAKKRFAKKPPFEWFKEADTLFAKYQIPSTLVVLAEGITVYPEWVAYIKDNLHRFKIELHGFDHKFYRYLSEEEGYQELKKAKEMIEDAFGVKIMTWYVPFGKRHFPEWGKRVCDRLGLEFDVTQKDHKIITFHYWYEDDVEMVNNILYALQRANPT